MQSGAVILGGTAVLLMMSVFIISFVVFYQQRQARQQRALLHMQEQHRRDLMASTFRGQEAERKRLAQDLHDSIGTMLSVTKMNLMQLEHKTQEADAHKYQLAKTKDLLDETITNVRRISRDLVPTTLERFGFLAALEELTHKISDTELSVSLECPDSLKNLPMPMALMLYRVTQELVNNAIKHAQAHHISIHILCADQMMRLIVADDGIGFNYDAILEDRHAGLGLRNIESRLNVLGGHVTFDTAPGRSTTVTVQVPTPSSDLS